LNHLQYAFDIAEHFVVPETQHALALSVNEPRPLSISHGLRMLAAIDLDNDACVVTCEIRDVSPESNLSPEMRSVQLQSA